MSENFKFFQHRQCEFFPCHNKANEQTFNCLFCYCPLYALGADCGGNFQYLRAASRTARTACSRTVREAMTI